MSSIFRRYSNSARLGDLLVQAGVLSPAQLQEAVKHSRSKKLQIGQVLVMSGHLTPKDLQVALEAQSMLRDKTIDINIAVQCIKVARKIGASFADVLEDYDESAAKRARTGKLGELLVDAGIISQEQLSQAMEQGLNTGMPLGRMLVLNEALQAEFLEKSLDVQVRLRDEMLTREEAVKALQDMAGVKAEDKKEPEKKREKKPIVRLGELLVMAGILSENDVMDALEWGLANQQPIGTVLVSQQLISQELLDAALFFQTCVKGDELDALKACECLSEVFSTGVTPEEALKEVTASPSIEAPDKPPIDYRTLVTMARVVSEDEIDKAFSITAHDAALIGKVLVLTGFMDVPTLQSTLRCYQMVSKGWLSPDDAIAALDYCLHQNQSSTPSFEQALRDLKWSPEGGLKMRGEKNLMKQTRENMMAMSQPSSTGKLAEKPALDSESADRETEEDKAQTLSATEKPDSQTIVEREEDSTESFAITDTSKSEIASGQAQFPGQEEELEAETSLEIKAAFEPEPEPEPELSLETEPEPVQVANTNNQSLSLDTLLGPLRNGDEGKTSQPQLEPELNFETDPVIEAVQEPVPALNLHTAEEVVEEIFSESSSSSPSSLMAALKEEESIETAPEDSIATEKSTLESKSEPVPELKLEPEPEPEPEDEDDGGGGLGALLQGIGGQKESREEAALPKRKMGGLLGGLIQKSNDEAATQSAANAEAHKLEAPEEKITSEAKDNQEQEPIAKAQTNEEKTTVGVSPDELKGLSAEQLLAQIEQGSMQHNSAKGMKRKGRFSDTILPEAAKARQLASLIARETSSVSQFDQISEDEDALGEAFERLAERHFEQGNYKEAQVIYERILVHKLNELGPESTDLIEDYNNLAMTLCIQKLFDKAEPFMKKAVSLYEKKEGKDPLAMADYLHSLGSIHYRIDRLEDAEEEFSRVLEIRKALLDKDHEDIGRTLTDYARVVKKLGQAENAEAIYKKAKEILKRNSQ